jgi:hypothetical protein
VRSQFLADCASVRDGKSTWDRSMAHPKIVQSATDSFRSPAAEPILTRAHNVCELPI